jgi:hypothetical protein
MLDKCKFGTGQQVMCECPMIYIHIFGYYPTKELYKEALRTLCPNYKKKKSLDPKATITNLFTFGKSELAQRLVTELQEIQEPRLRKYNIKKVQTLISRCGLGVNELTSIEHPHIRFELLVLWRKYWIDVLKKSFMEPTIKKRVRALIRERTREELYIAMEEVREGKEFQKTLEEIKHGNS